MRLKFYKKFNFPHKCPYKVRTCLFSLSFFISTESFCNFIWIISDTNCFSIDVSLSQIHSLMRLCVYKHTIKLRKKKKKIKKYEIIIISIEITEYL